MSPYSWVFEREALLATLQCTSRDQRRVIDAADLLARNPSQSGHLHYLDSDGKEIRVYFADHIAIHYNLDHAARFVRIVFIEENLPPAS